MSDHLPQTIGIDISKATLDCHAHPAGWKRQFANTPKGHKALLAWLGQWPIERIAYEATGTYHRAPEQALADRSCVRLNPDAPAASRRPPARSPRPTVSTPHCSRSWRPRCNRRRDRQKDRTKCNWPNSSIPAMAWCATVPRSRTGKRT